MIAVVKGLGVTAAMQCAPATRYFFHPESGSLFTTEDGSFPPSDGLVEEVDAEDYAKLAAEFAEYDKISPADSPPTTSPNWAPPWAAKT